MPLAGKPIIQMTNFELFERVSMEKKILALLIVFGYYFGIIKFRELIRIWFDFCLILIKLNQHNIFFVFFFLIKYLRICVSNKGENISFIFIYTKCNLLEEEKKKYLPLFSLPT